MKKGFTIVELVIVIAVIAILAAVLIPTFSNVISKANQSKALQTARNEYTAAYADAIAGDGRITKDDDHVSTNSSDDSKLDIETTNFTFTIDAATYAITNISSTEYSSYVDYIKGVMIH